MSEKRATGVVGGVCMAHAPQFFTLPETEDKATVDRVGIGGEAAIYMPGTIVL